MSERKHSHYYKDVSALNTIDVYRVLQLWEVGDPCLQHALKKILVAGGRGAKDARRDVAEAIDSLNRWIEMRDEEEPAGLWGDIRDRLGDAPSFAGPLPPPPQPWERDGKGSTTAARSVESRRASASRRRTAAARPRSTRRCAPSSRTTS